MKRFRHAAAVIITVLAISAASAWSMILYRGRNVQSLFIATESDNVNRPDTGGSSQLESGAEGALFLFSAEEKQLFIIGLYENHIISVHNLEFTPAKVIPTPGGVSSFVIYEDSSRIDVFSAQTGEFQRSNESGLHTVSDLSFSPNGDRVWVTGQRDGQSVLTEFSHQLLELSSPRSVDLDQIPLSAPVPNRRATRLYLPFQDRIAVLFGLSLEEIEHIDVGVQNLEFSEDYSSLYAVDADGHIHVIDERSNEVVTDRRTRTLSAYGEAVQSAGSIGLLSQNGDALYIKSPLPGADFESITLNNPADFIIGGAGGSHTAVSSDGQLQIISTASVVRTFDLRENEAFGTVNLSGGSASIVNRDGSFACF